MNVWYMLGIEPNSDADTIRKAYAQKVRQFHPEEHPQEFQRLNEAYRKALALASSPQRRPPVDERPIMGGPSFKAPEAPVVFNFPQENMPDNDAGKNEENGFDFEVLINNAYTADNRQQDMFAVLRDAYTLLSKGNSQIVTWRAFLRSESFVRFMDDPQFIGEFANILRNDYYTIRHKVYIEIKRAYFSGSQRNPKLPPYGHLARLLPMLIARSRARHPNRKAAAATIIAPFVIVGALMIPFLINGPASPPPAPTYAFSDFTNPIMPSNEPSPDKVNEYLSGKYPDVEFTIPAEPTSSGLLNVYRCSLPEYGGLEFDVFQYDYLGGADSLYDNLLEATVENTLASMGIKDAYDAHTGAVYLPVKDNEELSAISAKLPELPGALVEAYPFAKNAEIYFGVLSADAPYPLPFGIPRPLLADNGWLSDEASALETLEHMLDIYAIDYTPWTNDDALQQSLQYGEPATVLIDNEPQTFPDVRIYQGYMTAGSIYRLCLQLNIPVKVNPDGDFIIGTESQRVSMPDQGDILTVDVADYLGITFGNE